MVDQNFTYIIECYYCRLSIW